MSWNFKKNAVVEDVNAVPEQYRGIYVAGSGEHQGKHVINPIALALANDYDGVSSALGEEINKTKKLNTESAGRRQALTRFAELAQELGLTVEDGADLAELLKGHIVGLNDQVKGGKEAKINLDKVNQDWTKKLNTATQAEQAKTQKMQGSLERYLVGQAATAALASAGATSTELLLPHVRSRVKVVQDGEDFVARIVDGQGDIRMNSAGQPMSVADLVTEMKTQSDFAPAFKSQQGSGSGKPPGENKAPPQRQGDVKTPIDKIAAGLAKRQAGG